MAFRGPPDAVEKVDIRLFPAMVRKQEASPLDQGKDARDGCGITGSEVSLVGYVKTNVPDVKNGI